MLACWLVVLSANVVLPEGSFGAETTLRAGESLRVAAGDRTYADLSIEESREGTVAQVRAYEDGVSVLGLDARFPLERYRLVLDGRYSMPLKQADGRVRLFRDRVGKVLRFAVGVTGNVQGKKTLGWVELAPIPDFPKSRPSLTSPREAKVEPIPSVDRDDRLTGFRITRRNFHWSGAFGKASVVTFGREFPFRNSDAKLVFWEEASYTPMWVVSPKAMVGFEFIETWGGGEQGCFEPMSDRSNVFSKLKVVEDNQVRKIIQWDYALVNPDYRGWGASDRPAFLPTATEQWTIYPDGTAYRSQRYRPVLGTRFEQHGLGHQVAEVDVVNASDSRPEDILNPDALVALGPDGRQHVVSYPSVRKENDPLVRDWRWFALRTKFKDPSLPQPTISFAPRQTGSLALDLSIDDEKDWHREKFWRFSHFPFNHEPFMYETNSQTDGTGLVTHTCLAYVGCSRGRDWKDQFTLGPSGRPEREFVSVVGLDAEGSREALEARSETLGRPQVIFKNLKGAKVGKVDAGRHEVLLAPSGGPISWTQNLSRTAIFRLPVGHAFAGLQSAKGVRIAMDSSARLIVLETKPGTQVGIRTRQTKR